LGDNAPDLWLRNGDAIEVPDKKDRPSLLLKSSVSP
jgi:hypothetical protein